MKISKSAILGFSILALLIMSFFLGSVSMKHHLENVSVGNSRKYVRKQ